MTKAEFHLDIAGLYDNKEITEQIAIEAMKQHAIEFAEQIAADGWIISDDSKWVNVMDHRIPEGKEYTTEQLYERFNNQEP